MEGNAYMHASKWTCGCRERRAFTHEDFPRRRDGRRANGRVPENLQRCRWRLLKLIVSYTAGARWRALRPCLSHVKLPSPSVSIRHPRYYWPEPVLPVCRYRIDRAEEVGRGSRSVAVRPHTLLEWPFAAPVSAMMLDLSDGVCRREIWL